MYIVKSIDAYDFKYVWYKNIYNFVEHEIVWLSKYCMLELQKKKSQLAYTVE